MSGKYMAYVGSYSYTGKAKGITVFDVDVENGMFKERCEIEVDNSSYVIASSDGKTLYSIADEGVVSFRILQNGALARLNSAPIRGMRGCHLCSDLEDKFIFVSGYHDGKETVVRLKPDGSIGEVTDGVYHKGLGSVAERTFRPHVSCAERTPDGRFLLVADLGVFMMCRKLIPDMELHISTQANNTNWRSVKLWKDLGAKRVILAREMSLDEIKEIKKKLSISKDDKEKTIGKIIDFLINFKNSKIVFLLNTNKINSNNFYKFTDIIISNFDNILEKNTI